MLALGPLGHGEEKGVTAATSAVESPTQEASTHVPAATGAIGRSCHPPSRWQRGSAFTPAGTGTTCPQVLLWQRLCLAAPGRLSHAAPACSTLRTSPEPSPV